MSRVPTDPDLGFGDVEPNLVYMIRGPHKDMTNSLDYKSDYGGLRLFRLTD